MVKEERYYKNVAIWLEKMGYYIGRAEKGHYIKRDLFIRKGRKKAIVDVAGVKNIGKNYVDRIEIALIEVKNSRLTLRDIEQARSYSVYGHKCFLATTAEITQENIRDSSRRGVGLLKIPPDFYRKKPTRVCKTDIRIVLSPAIMTPSEVEMSEFLACLDILKCTVCGCYFNSWGEYEEEFPELPPKGGSFKRLERNKVFETFPDIIDDQYNTKHKLLKKKMWRHICLLCVEDLARLLAIQSMRKEIDGLRQEIEVLKRYIT